MSSIFKNLRGKKPLTETFPLFLEKKIIYAQFEEAQSISF